jgi:vitamin B12 transporter
MKQRKISSKKMAATAVGLAALTAPYGALAQEATLDTIVVTASRTQEVKREVSSNITVITEDEIKASTANSVADLMAQQGFFMVTVGDNSNVQIRGMGNLSMTNEYENTVLILLNGRRVGMSNLALASLANVERVEINRGPSAVQYGPTAMGGVVNVITKHGTGLKPFASVEVGFGSDSLKRQKVAFGGTANDFDFSFGGTNSSNDDVTVHNGRRWHHTETDKNQAYNLDLGYTFAKNHRVGIDYNYANIESELCCQGGGIRPYANNTPNLTYMGFYGPDDNYTRHRKFIKNTALSYIGAVDSKNLDWLVNYSFGDNDQIDKSPVTGEKNYKFYLDTKTLNAQLNYHGSLFSLSGGFDQFKYDTSSSSYGATPTKMHMKDTGFYLAGKLRLIDERLIFSLGLRHDKYENSGADMDSSKKKNHTGGSIGVSYLPLDWLKLRANYAEGFKMPTPTQLGGDGAFYYLPNPSLKPEESKTWEFGTDINWNNIDASLTYFHSDWENKIVAISGASGCSFPYWCGQNQNLKEAEIAGVEGLVKWDIGKAFKQNYSLTPYLSFTWLTTRKNKDPFYTDYSSSDRVEYHGKTKTLPNTPEWMASYGIDYAHPGLKLKTRLNANYYGKALMKDFSSTVTLPGNDTYFGRPSGAIVNWNLEKELVDFSNSYGKLTLRTEINNLFDGKNEMYWSYPGPGRSFYVGLRYDFQ